MARTLATRCVTIGVAFMLAATGCVHAQPTSGGPRAAPTRPAAASPAWTVVTLFGADYVSVRELGERLGLKPAWNKAETVMTLLAGADARLRVELNERDVRLDGIRVMLSEPAVSHRDSLWLAEIDVRRILAPLLRPADHLGALPASAPKLIVLDAGHGGTDPGKQNPRLKLDEKDMTLDVAHRVRKLLEARGFKVLMTRTTDKRFSNNPVVDLPMRADVANKAKADLFVSIHFNAVDPKIADRVVGSETYVLTPQHMESTQPESDKNLKKVLNPGNRQDLANLLLGFQLHQAMINRLKTSDRGFKRYRLAVLRPLNCPGALVEAAYLSNDAEAKRVGTPAFRQEIAESIAAGIQDYAAVLAGLRAAAR